MNEIRFGGRCEKHCSPLPCIACENTALQTALQERDAELGHTKTLLGSSEAQISTLKARVMVRDGTIAAQRKVLEQALEAMKYHVAQTRPIHQTLDAITAIQEQLKS